jgi:hypothetical protein
VFGSKTEEKKKTNLTNLETKKDFMHPGLQSSMEEGVQNHGHGHD